MTNVQAIADERARLEAEQRAQFDAAGAFPAWDPIGRAQEAAIDTVAPPVPAAPGAIGPEAPHVTEDELAAIAVAPRVTPADIEAAIAAEYFVTGDAAVRGPNHPALNTLTLCLLVLKNGFVIVGKSAPASETNFNREIGRRLAREDAIRQAWPLLGYALRDKIAGA